MIKKIFSCFLCFFTIVLNAQINFVSYPSESLTEETIAQRLENARKNGIKEAEIDIANKILHRCMQQQANAGTNNFQRTIAPPPHVNSSGCTNPGFEAGNTSGWTFEQGSNSSGANLPCPTCFTGVAGGVYEVTSLSGNSLANTNAGNNVGGDVSGSCSCSNTNIDDCTPEPYTGGIDRFGGFPVVAPYPAGNSHSLLINNSNCGDMMQKANYTFVVDASSTSFTYQYALVLQSGGHPANAQPYFSVDITNVTTGSVITCAAYNVSPPSSGSLAGWSISAADPSVYCKPWSTVILDFSSVIGNTVSINFTVSDCNAGGHFGYAYIDASCTPNQINPSNLLCTGGSTLLQGIPGMASYNWTGPVTGTMQNLPTSTPGSYTLTTISGTGAGCPADTFYYNLTQSGTVAPTVNLHAASDTICFGATDVLTASGTNTYMWLPGGQTTTTLSISASPTVTAAYSSNTYSVMGTNTVTSCANIATTTVTVKGNTLQVLNNRDTICTGGSTVITANGASSYTWSPGTGLGSVNSASVTASPTVNTIYTVNGNSNGCIGTSTASVTIVQQPTVTVTQSPVLCFGSCNGGASASSTAPYNTYSWTPGGATTQSITNLCPGPYTVNVVNHYCSSANTKTITVTSPVQLTESVTFTNSTCSSGNGVISISASGGVTPYTYQLNTGSFLTTNIFSLLTAGTYTFNTKDNNGCIASSTVTINQASVNNPTVNVNPANSTCTSGNGSVTVTGVGGTSPYTYELNTGAYTTATTYTALGVATYTVHIKDATGCIESSTVVISQGTINNPTVTINSANSTCSSGNGSVTVTGSGGTSPYTYELNAGTYTTSTNFTGLVAATYTIHIKDVTGCVETATVAITQASVINPTVTVNSPTLCAGTTTTLTAGGASTYTWSTGTIGITYTATPASTTHYTVTGTDANNCKASATSTVTVNSLPTLVITPTQTTICGGASDVLTASGANTYTWSTSATTTSISVTPTITTTYTLTGEITATGCTNKITKTISVINCSQTCITINTSGTWTVPASVCTATVYVWGGGGGSGGGVSNSNDNASGGGGGGACTFNNAISINTGQVYTITIGAGGTAGTAAGTNGGNGGSSTFTGVGGTLTAGGGFGSVGVTATTTVATAAGAGGAGATAGSGGTTFAGGSGSGGVRTTSSEVGGAGGGAGGSGGAGVSGTSGNATATSNSIGGAGGTGTEPGGAGASAVYTTASSTGVAGNIPGGGAAGEANYTTAEPGAAGGAGQVTICYNTPATILTNAAPTSQTVCTNATPTTISLTAAGGGLSYQWYSNTVNSSTGGTSIGGATGNSYIPSTTAIGAAYYYCVVNGSCGSNAISAVAQVGVSSCNTATLCPASMSLIGVDSTTTSNTFTSGFNVFCNNKAFYIQTNEPTTITDSINNLYTPCIEVLFDTYQTALSTNASMTLYEGGADIWCMGPSTSCQFEIGGTTGVVGSNWSLIAGYLDYTKAHSFVFSTTAAIPTTTVTLKSCWTNQVYNTFVWSASGVTSNTVTLPATTNIGKATYSITPAVAANAFTDFHDGQCKVHPALLNLGTYTVTYSFSDTVCTGTSTNYVFNVTQPNVTWTALPPLCEGSACVSLTNQLSTLAEPGGIWSGTGVSTSGNLYCPFSVGTHTVTYTAGTGTCSAAQTHSVTVNASPVVSVNSPTICAGSVATLTASGASTYTWSTGATGVSISPSPTITANYTVTGTNANNCTKAITSTVTVNSAPNITVNTPVICTGATTTLTANGASTYTWSTNATSNSIVVSPPITADFTVTGTGSNNCTKAITATVSVNPLPNVSITPAQSVICIGSSTSSDILTASGANTYTWSANAGSATTSSVSVSPAGNTTYSVTGTNTATGCKNTAMQAITVTTCVTNYPPSASPAIICAGNSATISIPGSQVGDYYGLVATTNTTSTVGNPVMGTGGSISFSTGPLTASATYAIVGVMVGTQTLVMNPLVTITVNPLPNVTANAVTICLGGTATLTASGASTYTWNTGATGATITSSPIITTNYIVTGTSANNCIDSNVTTITVNPLPTINVNSDTLCLGDSTILTAQGASTYIWIPSTYLSNTNGASVVASPTTSVTYTVIGSDANICKNYTTSSVIVLDSNSTFCKTAVSTVVNVNNAFSPNGDGLNETFIIDNIQEYKNHVYVYNRWGQLLWHKPNYDNINIVWDGKTQEGVVLYSGTYFYLVEIEGQKTLKGWVELTK